MQNGLVMGLAKHALLHIAAWFYSLFQRQPPCMIGAYCWFWLLFPWPWRLTPKPVVSPVCTLQLMQNGLVMGLAEVSIYCYIMIFSFSTTTAMYDWCLLLLLTALPLSQALCVTMSSAAMYKAWRLLSRRFQLTVMKECQVTAQHTRINIVLKEAQHVNGKQSILGTCRFTNGYTSGRNRGS